MDSAAKESISSEHLSERLGGLILKDEQKLAVEALMSGKDVLVVLPTGLSKSVIYQSFVVALLCSSHLKDSHYLKKNTKLEFTESQFNSS